ncbi:MAG: Tn3 family transposase [Bryobacteraceae bacterium]
MLTATGRAKSLLPSAGCDLLPRLKNIHSQRLYRPASATTYSGLAPVLTRAIDWDLIAQQYDPMVQYATALRLGTAQTEDIPRCSTDVQHPVYRALAELGKVENNLPVPVSWIARTPARDQ